MQVLFDSNAIERTNSFGLGIDPEPHATPFGTPDKTLDDRERAWYSGFVAGRDGEPCIPPRNLGKLLRRTWRSGWRKGAPHAPNLPGLAPTIVHASEMAEFGPVDESPIEPEPEPVLTEPAAISPEDRAWFESFGLARDGIDAAEPSNVSPSELAAWRDGKAAAIRGKAICEANRRALADAAIEAARNRAGVGGPR